MEQDLLRQLLKESFAVHIATNLAAKVKSRRSWSKMVKSDFEKVLDNLCHDTVIADWVLQLHQKYPHIHPATDADLLSPYYRRLIWMNTAWKQKVKTLVLH